MKKLFTLIAALLLTPFLARAADPSIVFVNNLTDNIITNILSTDASKEEKLVKFRASFEQDLDMKNIGQFVLGVYWRSANPQERDSFLKAFIDFTTKTWADRFDLYTGQKITFTGTRNAEGKNQLYVNSIIQNNPPVEVVWRLKQDKDGSFKIIDIIVEGVSMAMSYRNEYSAFLQKNNGDLAALTKELERKSAEFQFTNHKTK